MSTNISQDYIITNYATNSLEREKSITIDGVATSGTLDIMAYRASINGTPTIRLQTTSGYYQTFIGEQKQ
jgi:hypothetical protein